MNLVFLAQRIREIRKTRGMTLGQLAERSQLTQSVLSKVENFRVTPSLVALGRIAEGLGVTFSELVAGIDEKKKIVLSSSADGPLVDRDRPNSDIVYRSLAATRHARLMEPLMLEVPPGEPRQEALPHEGEEFLIVIEGTVELEYGLERFCLRKGQCAYFDATEKHRLLNPGKRTAKVLCVFSGARA